MSPVTDHAVVRWLERLHGFELTERYPRASDRRRAEIGCGMLGLTLAEARDRVCPPRLHEGLKIGTGLVKGSDRTLRVVEGRVVTCLAAERRPRFGVASGLQHARRMPRE